MNRAAPWLAAALGLGAVLALFWPGYLSWDSAYAWWQARHAEFDPTQPPVLPRTWALARAVLPDPGGMLLLQLLPLWAGLALVAQALGGSASRRVALVLSLGLWPPVLALQPHLWKDLWMIGGFTFAIGCLAMDLRHDDRRWRLAALLALAAATAFRMNALPGALPMLAWLAWREGRGQRFPRLATVAGTGALALLVAGAGALANHVPGRAVPMWPALAMWDLAAVSIAEDRNLFPPDWVDPALTVDDLRRDFSPWVNVPSFRAGQLRLNFYYEYTPAQYEALRAAWLALPREHAGAYAAHRWTVSRGLLGLEARAQPDYLVLQPGVVAFRDNPPLARREDAANRRVQSVLDHLVDAPVFAPALYLLAALAVLAHAAWRRAAPGLAALAVVVALSAWALALPLAVLAPSTDFRYLGWPVLAGGLALWLAWAGHAHAGEDGLR